MIARFCVGASLLLACCLMTGCGPNDGRIEVTGTVMVDGAPMAGVSVAFIGNGGGAYGTGSTDAEGKFTIRAAQGINQIAVMKADTSGVDQSEEVDPDEEEEGLMGTMEEAADAEANAPKGLVAARFGDPATSGIEIDVQEGMEPVEIAVTKD